jgi:hypothetical protein
MVLKAMPRAQRGSRSQHPGVRHRPEPNRRVKTVNIVNQARIENVAAAANR